ncbi:hypothetical protein EAF04_008747 [Stromatinia cepivora]|nr:hypothetical protein EAF04_008747 [Stromatinia cepivora]
MMKSIPFYKVCKLLDEFEGLLCRTVQLLPDVRLQKMSHAWISWFKLHRDALDAMHKDDPSVLFTLKPEALDDRDYDFNEVTFERFIARTFCMTVEQRAKFKSFAENGPYLSVPNPKGGCNDIVRNDIGYHVERIMKEIGRDTDQETIFAYKNVTVEEIDDSLTIVAAQSEGSSAAIRSLAQPGDKCTWNRLEEIYLRLQGSQAKWLTRIIHKDLGFVVPDEMVLSAYHTSFPRYLQVTAKFNIKGLVPIRRDGQTGMIFGHPPLQTAEEIRSKDEVITGPSIARSTQSIQQLVSPLATRPFPLSESTTSSLNVAQIPTQEFLPKDSNNIEFPRKSSARRILRSSTKLKSSRLLTTNIFTGTGRCKQTPNCVFNNTIFILAPCISSHLWLTEDLLKPHGATYITSLLPLTHRVLPKRCPNTGRRVRKIALAEHGRKEQTLAFMHQIKALNLTRSNGKHDLIEVVDWRLLEKIVNVELGNAGEIDDIFKRYRLGVA